MKPGASQVYFIIGALAFIVMISGIYGQTAGFGFVNVDDDIYVRDNPHIRQGITPQSVRWAFTADRGGLWIPLTWLSFMADHIVSGPDPGRYHLNNIIFHAGAVLLLFASLRSA